jgi:hypothetical protein
VLIVNSENKIFLGISQKKISLRFATETLFSYSVVRRFFLNSNLFVARHTLLADTIAAFISGLSIIFERP